MRETVDESRASQLLSDSVERELGLVVIEGGGPRWVSLAPGEEVVLGRHPSCQLSLPHPTLSRFHARFVRRGSLIHVEDMGSRHGTWVLGQRVERAELAPGATVRLADLVVSVAKAFVAPLGREVVTASSVVPGALYLGSRMREVLELLHRAAATELPVLIRGETGTGKELAAQELHMASARRDAPLRVLNCAAIPTHLVESTLFGHERGAFTGADRARVGIFEEAHGGTLFLDELGELSPAAQAALLRVLETRRLSRVGSNREIEVDVRIVSATHRDLAAMSERGEFRMDLMHRLLVVSVDLPPLRERRNEIADLARSFLLQIAPERQWDPQALSRLEDYSWPGNLRELRNVIARTTAFAKGTVLTVGDLPEQIGESRSTAKSGLVAKYDSSTGKPEEGLRARLKSVEYAEVLRALEQTGGNQRRAADLLGIPLRTFERRLQAARKQGSV